MSTITRKTFGTRASVFTLTVLSILGVIMYIRQSLVVGNAGIPRSIAIIAMADLNIFSLDSGNKLEEMTEIARRTRISALFCPDSGFENAFV